MYLLPVLPRRAQRRKAAHAAQQLRSETAETSDANAGLGSSR